MNPYKWLLLMDLDGTLWDHLDISSLKPPFKQIDSETIRDSNNIVVKLKLDMIEFIKWARKNGALVSTLSWNDPFIAYQAIKTFGLLELFDYLAIENTPRKDKVLNDLLSILRRNGMTFKECEIVYIDDRDIHIEEIYRSIGKIQFYKVNKDFKNIDELKGLIVNRLKDCQHRRNIPINHTE